MADVVREAISCHGPVTDAGHTASERLETERPMPNLVPLQDVIATAGVSRSTIDRWRRRKLLDSYRSPGVDRRVYIDLDQVVALRRKPPLVRLEPRRYDRATSQKM